MEAYGLYVVSDDERLASMVVVARKTILERWLSSASDAQAVIRPSGGAYGNSPNPSSLDVARGAVRGSLYQLWMVWNRHRMLGSRLRT